MTWADVVYFTMHDEILQAIVACIVWLVFRAINKSMAKRYAEEGKVYSGTSNHIGITIVSLGGFIWFAIRTIQVVLFFLRGY